MGKKSRYGVILDAGSSGTRLHIYRWKNPEKALKSASQEDLRNLPKLVTSKKWTKKIRPGVSTFGGKPEDVGPEHLQSLIDHALRFIPADSIQDTPIFLMATAGMRLLPQLQQTALTREICSYLRRNTEFSLPDCNLHIQVIKGETEGLYGWIASNYLLGGFDHPDRHQHGKGHHTYGFLDMGGASAQIAFAPNATEAEKHADDLKLLRLRTLDGYPAEYKVFTTTWLGFGVNQARESYVQNLGDRYAETGSEFPDPCLPKGLRTTLRGDPVSKRNPIPGSPTLIGTGHFDECLQLTYPLLGKDMPCEDIPCLLNGQHVPAIDFDVNHFIGVSEYWHTTHGVFGGKDDEAYDFATYQQRVQDFCGRDWDQIKAKVGARKQDDVKIAQEACFKASWLINVLHEGIGVPRIGLEEVPAANVSKGALEHAKEKGFLSPFQPVNKIDGVEVSWTLGKMVLYAAGQIPPATRDDRYPVGFGSNVDGTPHDFQFAGSSWKPMGNQTSDDDDDWGLDAEDILDKAKVKSTTGFFAFVALLLLFLYFFRKRDRRMRLYSRVNSVLRRPRRPGHKGSSAGGLSGLATKLFGGGRRSSSGGAYERVMEEGQANQFELGDVESDDANEYSDSSDSSKSAASSSSRRLGLSSGLATPQVVDHHYHHGLASPTVSALDRSGLVVRTDSRERLALPPHLALSGVGRRSRAGSPTRMKSPLISPLQET
ncbi:nucleoside phosphatase family-domain-containing protein [Parachaetomium inaequale]|uniref:Nucleoside phosphatase family-domain-containing protein n=1 Tax=Parachaetomium inaequale TaxID=2588326 RepID=A0AAN6PQL6_9PEZI|nr:nucleoside phosphatase family-domain-containing protein [Parachaetomium inaequale]